MPTVNIPIKRAFRYAGEENRIHFVAIKADGTERHCKVDKGDALYQVIESWFDDIGYEGPASAKK